MTVPVLRELGATVRDRRTLFAENEAQFPNTRNWKADTIISDGALENQTRRMIKF